METRKKNKKEQEILDKLIAQASKTDNFYAMEELLKEGADPNAEVYYSGSNSTTSLLHQAAVRNQFHICELLLAHGANVNNRRKRNGHTVLHDFASCAHNFNCPDNPKRAPYTFRIHSVFSLLHENGADLNAQDDYGMTPLHLAVLCGNLEFCILAVRSWAKTDVEDRGGETPLDYARDRKDERIVQFLEKQLIWQP